ncbi:XdhC family protein [Ferrimonas balearica]|uniref:XdhC family protein n=1 Tax=Ferrimonas balearica TaxID=44012 RepID=UPI001C98F8B9|nr:XdhC/CoxI family protein [Ferrimonas balearica]MBY5993187.1 XdhC family protein [Ferrimonas balearica]
MTHHPFHLIRQWLPQRDDQQWVLGTVYHTAGSAYRKAGALMLFSSDGAQLGLLSGGCLESDLQRQAMRVMASGRALTREYDSQDEDDVVFQLGIGCGGVVQVMLQPVHADNHYLALEELHQALADHQSVLYHQSLPQDGADNLAQVQPLALARGQRPPRAGMAERAGRTWLVSAHRPPPMLAIFGAGVDARPLAQLAVDLGWQVILVDPRPSHGRPQHFPSQCRLLNGSPTQAAAQPWFAQLDAAIVMHHQQGLDGEALALLAQNPPPYCALLGPRHRRAEVLEGAGLDAFPNLAGPAGLALGAELPEGIALSILAECHAALHHADGHSLSGVLQ